MNKTLTLVFGDQLFENHPALKTESDYLLVESLEECKRLKYHKFKLAYILTCLREYRDYLESNKQKVHYFNLDQEENFETVIKKTIQEHKYEKVQLAETNNKYFRNNIKKILKDLKIEYKILDSHSFLTSRKDFEKYRKESGNKLLLNSFYIWQRKRLNIFVDKDKKPWFKKWSFDSSNRKKLSKNIELLDRKWEYKGENYTAVCKLINKYFKDNPGELNSDYSWLPVNHKDSKAKLKEFFKESIFKFGDYQDAITNRGDFVFHSVLSPMINNGLLTPHEVILELVEFTKSNQENIEEIYNSIEGFLRQLIGWREWVKWLYEFEYDDDFNKLNFFEAKESLPEYFYYPDSSSDKNELKENTPLSNAIKRTQKLAWSHHIERLMILANWMTLNSYNPKECYNWFLSQCVDGYEWVMVANVYGMGLFADGGKFATKPYISGGNYLKKMSDYKDTGWADVWTEKYWRFLEKNYSKLKDNPRMRLILSKIKK
jgi:deoxyribodipyrimidine photolyase-related protein